MAADKNMEYVNWDTVQYSNANTAVTNIVLFVSLIFLILNYIGLWTVFKKAGVKGWKCLIPFYNSYLLFRISMGNGWLFLLSIVPVVNLVMAIVCMYNLAKAFHAGLGFTIGLIFFGPIFLIILGAGKYQYTGTGGNVHPI